MRTRARPARVSHQRNQVPPLHGRARDLQERLVVLIDRHKSFSMGDQKGIAVIVRPAGKNDMPAGGCEYPAPLLPGDVHPVMEFTGFKTLREVALCRHRERQLKSRLRWSLLIPPRNLLSRHLGCLSGSEVT